MLLEDLSETETEPEKIHLLYLLPPNTNDNTAYGRAVDVLVEPFWRGYGYQVL